MAGLAVLIMGRDHDAASAGAWNQATGHGLVIVDGTVGEGERFFDETGRLRPARRYVKSELSGYVEYGWTDWLTVVARPSLVSTRLGDPGGGRYLGSGGTDAGAQLRLLVFGPAVLAAQGTFHVPGTVSRRNPAEIGSTAREADLRGLAGLGFEIGRLPAFVDLEGSYRLRSGGAASQWHGDVTFGFSPLPRVSLLFQSFTTIPDGPGAAWFPSARYTKVAASVVYKLSSAIELSLGIFTTVTGRDALRERGVTTGVWYRF